MTKKNYAEFCPVRNILDRFGDKWSLLILTAIHDRGTVRFGELGRAIPDISQKMLTSTLRTLVGDGYLSRHAYAEIPPRVEYALTALCGTLVPHSEGLVAWAPGHRTDVLSSRSDRA